MLTVLTIHYGAVLRDIRYFRLDQMFSVLSFKTLSGIRYDSSGLFLLGYSLTHYYLESVDLRSWNVYL